MELLEGCELIELTDDKIVQEYREGGTVIRMIGNPNPPEKEHQECIDNVARILLRSYQRTLQKKNRA